MTPWTNVFLLVSVALGLIVPSAQGDCNLHYFSLTHYRDHLNAIVPFVEASNLKDSMECSAERACLKEKRTNGNAFIPFLNCFGREIEEKCTETPKCMALNSNRNIDYYHFLCLTAEALEINITSHDNLVCAHDFVCSLIQNLPRDDQTTKQPPPITTTTTTTTATATTTTTTVKAKTLPETTAAAPTMSQPGPQPLTASGTAHSQSQLINANSSATSEEVKTNQQPVFLIVLVVVLVILLVMSLFYIIHLRRQLHTRTDGLVLRPTEVQPMAEMKPHVCHCVATSIAEQNNHEWK